MELKEKLTIEKVDDYRFIIPRSEGMRVPGLLYASQKLLDDMALDDDDIIELLGHYTHKKYPEQLRRIELWDEKNEQLIVLLTNHLEFGSTTIAAIYKERWQIGASRQGRMIQSVKVRPRLIDSGPRSLEGAVAREQDGEALRQHSLKGGCATHQVVTYSERRRSLVTRIPVAETVDNVRRQQEITGMSHIRYFSPAGYQRRHGVKDHAETGEALDTR